MVMTYTSLAAPKGTAGSIANWSNSTKIDVATVITEAESLLYNVLRVREMRAEWVFGMTAGSSQIALPDRFLDPIGMIYDLTNFMRYPQRTVSDAMRAFDDETTFSYSPSNQLGLTFTTGSSLVALYTNAINAGIGDVIRIAGVPLQGGVSPNGSFPVTIVIDASTVVIDMGRAAATTGGVLFSSADVGLIPVTRGWPTRWAISDERVKFDMAFSSGASLKLDYFRSPAPLSESNPSNWLVARYPNLMRKACQAAAADFLKDETEYQKNLTAMTALAGTIMSMDDLSYRGASFGTDTP